MTPSIPQILIVLAVILIIFGPKKIPGIGKALGQAIRGFKKGVTGESEEQDKSEEKSEDNNKS